MGDLIIKPEAGGSIKLQNNAGTNALVSDNSGNVTLAGTSTLTNAIITAGTFPAGHVLQVVSYLATANGSQSIGQTDAVMNGMTKDVTPKGANSDFLVEARWWGEINSPHAFCFNITMGGTRQNAPGNYYWQGLAMGIPGLSANFDSSPERVQVSTLIENSSSVIGTDITFALIGSYDSTITIYNNRCSGNAPQAGYEQGTSELIITEIKG